MNVINIFLSIVLIVVLIAFPVLMVRDIIRTNRALAKDKKEWSEYLAQRDKP